MTGKLVISENGNYRVIANLKEMQYPSDTVALSFSTVFTDAADPTAEQQKFIMFLNKNQREMLKQLL